MGTHDTMKVLGPAFLGWQLWQLLSTIDVQGDELLSAHGLKAPSRASSVIMILYRMGPQRITELGKWLDMSHQLISHRFKILKNNGLVVSIPDPSDRRSNVITLSPAGRKEAKRISQICKKTEIAYQDLYEETGVNLSNALAKAIDALKARPLVKRVQ